MYKYLIDKGDDVTRVVESFPSSSANEFDLDAASDAVQFHRGIEFPDGQRVNIRESVGARMSATSVNNSTKNVLMIGGGGLEMRIIGLNTTLQTKKVLVVQLVRAQLALVRPVFSKVGIIFLFRLNLEMRLSLSEASIQCGENCQQLPMTAKRRRPTGFSRPTYRRRIM